MIELSKQEQQMFDEKINSNIYFMSTIKMNEIGDFFIEKDQNGFIYIAHKNKRINRYLSKEISHIFGLQIHEDWDLGYAKSRFNCYNFGGFDEKNYQYLLERNPKLQILDRYFPEKKKDIYYGAISLFNFQDIWYFCKHAWVDRPSYITELSLKLEIKLGVDFPWVASWNTLKKIKKHYENGNMIKFEKLNSFKY